MSENGQMMADDAGAEREAAGPNASPRALIIDDHPVIIAGCRVALAHAGFGDIASAASGEEGCEAYAREAPDVVVVDINLPGISGFETARKILEADPEARILFFSMNEDPIFAARAIASGAKGYISKGEDPLDFIAAVKTVANGGVFLKAELARRLSFYEKDSALNPLQTLSDRDLEILRHLCNGKSVAEIAEILGMSSKTAANAATAIKNKLGARSIIDMVRIASQHRLI